MIGGTAPISTAFRTRPFPDLATDLQASDAKLVYLDDTETRAPDRQAADDQPADGERANRDSADRERTDGEGADGLRFDRLGADGSGPESYCRRASRGPFFHVTLHWHSCAKSAQRRILARLFSRSSTATRMSVSKLCSSDCRY